MMIHTVQSGETVYSISEEYGVSEELLIVNNGLENITNSLPVGLGIVILTPKVTYSVKPNDTARSIAARFGISINTLYRRNLILGGNDALFPGQTLVIEYTDEPIYSFLIGGYYYTSVSLNMLNETLPYMKLFMPFTFGFDSDGTIVELDADTLLERGYYYGSSPYFHLSTLTEEGGFSNELAHQILIDSEKWSVLADNIIQIMQEKGYVGLDIDFEFLLSSDRELYPEFITYMKNRVNEYSYPLIVALPPKISSDQPGELYEGIDYRLLGEAADFVLLMTYEYPLF